MQQGSETSDYLEAFMSGFEFVLLAIRGRLADARLSDDERERLLAFLEDYERIARAYHARTSDAAAARGDLAALAGARAFHAEVSAVAVN
jgi:hypothetical protein